MHGRNIFFSLKCGEQNKSPRLSHLHHFGTLRAPNLLLISLPWPERSYFGSASWSDDIPAPSHGWNRR